MKSFLLSVVMLSFTITLTAQENVCDTGFRLFEHELLATEPVCIPDEPQRIVTLDGLSFETLMVIGQPPIAAPSAYIRNYTLNYPTRASQTEVIEDLGRLSLTGFEALLATEPDLIIGDDSRILPFYEQLSTIAPTLLFTFNHSGAWQDVAEFVTSATKREAAYETQLAAYNDRLEIFQSNLDDENIIVSVVRVRPIDLRLYVADSFPGSVIADAGLSRPPSQQYDYEQLREEFDATTFYAISRENIQLADGDIIFVWSSSPSAELAEDTEDRRQALLNDPLWQSLEATQADTVYIVGSHWIGSSFAAAHAVLDDLFIYVLGIDPAEIAPNPIPITENTNTEDSE